MDDLSYLSTLSDMSFEAERCRLIGEEIQKAPPEIRRKLILTQMKLDAKRDGLTPEQFMALCFREATENLENMADQFVAIGHLMGMAPCTRS